jgi:hypothetical protein
MHPSPSEAIGRVARCARPRRTTALENGCSLEDVQRAAGHREPSTTKLYDHRGYNQEKSASFFTTY